LRDRRRARARADAPLAMRAAAIRPIAARGRAHVRAPARRRGEGTAQRPWLPLPSGVCPPPHVRASRPAPAAAR
jgi:hypothetical protein